MIHFIRLTRPVNLVIIAITMYGLGWYFEGLANIQAFGIQSFDFFLLVLSTTMIAAAGNIINDYFDVRADRVNKPERLIIGVTIKRRVAIVTHWGINFLAFSIAAYLSWRMDTFWYVFIHLLSINMLWYYSSYFKRKFLIGNIMIAGLTAMVPLLVGLYYFQSYELASASRANVIFEFPFVGFTNKTLLIFLSVALAGYAFLLNLAREIVKDMEDVKGDENIKAQTLPIVLGSKTSKLVIILILAFSIVMTGFVTFFFPTIEFIALIPLYLSAILVIFAIIMLLLAKEKLKYKMVNMWIKLAMVVGLFSPVYWKLLLYYA